MTEAARELGAIDETRIRAIKEVSRTSVRHFATDFASLEAAFQQDTYPRLIVRGEGAYLWDEKGHVLLDAGAHLGACQIGHGRQEIAEAASSQLTTLEYIGLETGVSHPVVATLAERLAPLVPVADPAFFFCSSGSEANDIAFKVARAYHRAQGEAGRFKILARAGSFHGSTFGGISATGHPGFRESFAPVVPGFVRVAHPSPGRCGYCEIGDECSLRCADEVERVIRQEGPETVAAFVGEPVGILQAVRIPAAGYWARVRDICDAHGILLIADEVVTGFGRTGKLFGSEHWAIRPDIVTMAKGLTSGYIPMGAAVVSGRIGEALPVPFLHINTYAGHPVASAVALEALEILEREQLVEASARLGQVLASALADLETSSDGHIARSSAIGLLGCVEFRASSDAQDLPARLRHELYERGVAARAGLGDGLAAVLFYPPLVVDERGVLQGVAAVGDMLRAAELIPT